MPDQRNIHQLWNVLDDVILASFLSIGRAPVTDERLSRAYENLLEALTIWIFKYALQI